MRDSTKGLICVGVTLATLYLAAYLLSFVLVGSPEWYTFPTIITIAVSWVYGNLKLAMGMGL